MDQTGIGPAVLGELPETLVIVCGLNLDTRDAVEGAELNST